MERVTAMVLPLILALTSLWACAKRVDVYDALTAGGKEGLRTVCSIFPSLVALMTAVSMFRASGAMDWLCVLLAPLMERLGIPVQLVPLMLVRPISGSAALGVGSDMIHTYGPDSYLGRVAAVMLGSTETTFYVAAVYFGSLGISRTRYAIPAALCADAVGFWASAWAVRLIFGT